MAKTHARPTWGHADERVTARGLVALNARSELPVAVGFGISTTDQVREVWRYADAAVVGSAVVAEIEKLDGAPDLVKQVGDFVRALLPQATALPNGAR